MATFVSVKFDTNSDIHTWLHCSVDNKICAGVSRDPSRYLVPHPTDCTKFYSCQRNGWGGWIANLMDCPVTTGFDR